MRFFPSGPFFLSFFFPFVFHARGPSWDRRLPLDFDTVLSYLPRGQKENIRRSQKYRKLDKNEKKKNSPRFLHDEKKTTTKNTSLQGLGVGALRRSYGGRDKSRGVAPERHALAAGGLVRHILQQLESIGIVEKSADGKKKGRRITPQGQRDLDLIAGRCPRDVKPVFGAQPEPPVEAVAADE